MKKLARFLSIALLLVTGFLGLYNGSTELGEALTRVPPPTERSHIPPS